MAMNLAKSIDQLLNCLASGDRKGAKTIIRRHPYLLNFDTLQGWPIIHRYLKSECADPEIVHLYLNCGGDPNRRTNSGVSLLFLAATCADGDAVFRELSAVSSKMTPFEEGIFILTNVVDEDEAQIRFTSLLDKHPEIVRETGDDGYTLLHHAVRGGPLLLRLLLERGASVTAITFSRRSALGLLGRPLTSADAVSRTLLISKGATYTPQEDLIEELRDGNVESLAEKISGNPSVAYTWIIPHGPLLHWAAWLTPTPNAVDQILRAGVNPDTPNEQGETALHRTMERAASDDATLDIIRVLVSFGADLNRQSISGDTPLHAAASSGWEEPLKFLIKLGAEANSLNAEGKTPLDIVYAMRFLGGRSLADWMKTKGAVRGRDLK